MTLMLQCHGKAGTCAVFSAEKLLDASQMFVMVDCKGDDCECEEILYGKYGSFEHLFLLLKECMAQFKKKEHSYLTFRLHLLNGRR